jgi:hypothetical protein
MDCMQKIPLTFECDVNKVLRMVFLLKRIRYYCSNIDHTYHLLEANGKCLRRNPRQKKTFD